MNFLPTASSEDDDPHRRRHAERGEPRHAERGVYDKAPAPRGGYGPFLAWPGWRQLGRTVVLGAALLLWWLLVYGGTNWVAGLHTFRVRLHLDAERSMPFWPPMVLLYHSIHPLYWLAPFVLRRRGLLEAFCLANGTVMLAAGLFFLIFPADLAYLPAAHAGAWEDLVQLTHRVALQHNLAPSLHVALTVTCVTIYAERAPRRWRLLLWAWALGIVASTLLLHEHHLLDVVTGWPLGLAGKYLVYDRLRIVRFPGPRVC